MNRIEIKDYQGIERAAIELAAGVTVLAGPSDSGKSSIVRALRDWAYNSIGDGHVQAGKDAASVTVDGITWEKGKKVNRYTLADGTVYDKVGRGQVPDDVQGLTGIREISYGEGISCRLNVAGQFDPEFAVGFKGSDNAKIIGSISRLEQVFNAIREATADHSRARKQEEASKGKLAADKAAAESLAWVDAVVADYEKAVRRLGEALDAEAKLARLADYAARASHAAQVASRTAAEARRAQRLGAFTVGQIEALGAKLKALEALKARLGAIKAAHKASRAILGATARVGAQNRRVGEIQALGARLQGLDRMLEQSGLALAYQQKCEGQRCGWETDMEAAGIELKRVLDSVETCPLTGGPRLCKTN
jgi:DNA repair ATPase RecN